MDYKIIDFHTHPYFEHTENFCMYKDSLQLSPTDFAEDLKQNGISVICGSVISNVSYNKEKGWESIERLNDIARKIKVFYGDFYMPGFHVHPSYVKESLETIEFMHQNGYRLIGEIVPYMHGWSEAGLDYGSKELQEILSLAGEYEMIFSYHTMINWQQQMENMIANNPKVTFVAAHPGEKEGYMLHLERMKKYENAYLDVSATGLFRYGMLREGIQKVGADRFLFGTDYPIVNPGMYVQAVRCEHISDDDRDKIFYRNAERILKIRG